VSWSLFSLNESLFSRRQQMIDRLEWKYRQSTCSLFSYKYDWWCIADMNRMWIKSCLICQYDDRDTFWINDCLLSIRRIKIFSSSKCSSWKFSLIWSTRRVIERKNLCSNWIMIERMLE
jgi:hypothetical protein